MEKSYFLFEVSIEKCFIVIYLLLLSILVVNVYYKFKYCKLNIKLSISFEVWEVKGVMLFFNVKNSIINFLLFSLMLSFVDINIEF